MGVLFVLLSNLVSRRMPALAMTLLLVSCQILTGLVLEWLAAASPSPGKLIGAALIVVGLLIPQGSGPRLMPPR